jgi:sulfite dehydrogenase
VGYSTGRWEGDTLVVQTAGFRDGIWLDANGSPTTESARVTERFRRVNFGTLEIEVTVDDLKAYTSPWTVKLNQLIVLDSDPDITSKPGLFRASWKGLYPDLIDYRPNSELADVDVKGMTVRLTFDSVKGDVLNVVPPHRAGDIAQKTGLITANQRWCGVDWLTMESVAVKGVHVLADATLSAPAMPKSASMANQHAKVCAAAVIALIKGQPVNQQPMMMNTCYSFVDGKNVMHVASVHTYDAAQKTMVAVKGAGGLSDKASELEGTYAWGWARNIWAEALG